MVLHTRDSVVTKNGEDLKFYGNIEFCHNLLPYRGNKPKGRGIKLKRRESVVWVKTQFLPTHHKFPKDVKT